MKNRQQIFTYLSSLQSEVKEAKLQLQKYQQETQYVCLKVGVKDWMQFLTDVRLGHIGKVWTSKVNSQNSTALKTNSALSMFNDFFENASTQRNTIRKEYCECQSPIQSEARIQRIKGGDTSRSESSVQEARQHYQSKQTNQTSLNQTDPFIKYKITDVCPPGKGLQEESIEEILKYIEKYQTQKNQQFEGFDTFRKVSDIPVFEKMIEDTTTTSERQAKSPTNQQTIKIKHRVYQPFLKERQANFEEDYMNIQYENIDSQSEARSAGDEYLLAVQNTKLRRQIKELESKIKRREQ